MSTFGAFEKGHILINMLAMEMALQQPALNLQSKCRR
jgi:hypothetical protein